MFRVFSIRWFGFFSLKPILANMVNHKWFMYFDSKKGCATLPTILLKDIIGLFQTW